MRNLSSTSRAELKSLKPDDMLSWLDAYKVSDVVTLDVSHLTPLLDHMIIGSAKSPRHVTTVCQHLMREAKSLKPSRSNAHGVEDSNWGLVDLGDVIVHIMTDEARDFYQIEKLWDHAEDEDSQQQLASKVEGWIQSTDDNEA